MSLRQELLPCMHSYHHHHCHHFNSYESVPLNFNKKEFAWYPIAMGIPIIKANAQACL